MPADEDRDPGRRRLLRASAQTTGNSLVASAKVLTASRTSLQQSLPWQEELWNFYDSTPELRYGIGYLANALSRVRLFAGEWEDNGDEPVAIDVTRDEGETETRPAPTSLEQAAVDLMAQLCEGPIGQAQMLNEFATHLSLPGLGYLVGIPRPELPRDEWVVLSQDELTVKAGDSDTGFVWVRKVSDNERENETLPPETLVVKVHRPHKRKHWMPDSPARGQVTVLRELALLTAHVEASATSRLAGAGLLLLPSELQFPVSEKYAEADDPFLMEFIEVTTTPIKDRSSAAAMVPYPLRVPGEWVDKIKHLTFATPLDEKAIALREEAIRRFATGMDLPADVVTGVAKMNHWGAWQVEEAALRLHISPMAETICEGLTIGYLKPGLLALGYSDEEVANFVVWYDPSALSVQPDKSGDALSVYKERGIGVEALRRHTGFADGDAPTDDELRRDLLIQILEAAPELAPTVFPMLGLGPVEAKPPLGTTSTGPGAPADGAPADTAGPGVPDTHGDPPDPGQAALLAASDQLVRRALERSGNRLLSALRKGPAKAQTVMASGNLAELGDVATEEVHTRITDPTSVVPLDELLAGAWTGCAEVAHRCEVDRGALVHALDGYTRGLLAGRQSHSWERMVSVLGGEHL